MNAIPSVYGSIMRPDIEVSVNGNNVLVHLKSFTCRAKRIVLNEPLRIEIVKSETSEAVTVNASHPFIWVYLNEKEGDLVGLGKVFDSLYVRWTNLVEEGLYSRKLLCEQFTVYSDVTVLA